MIQRLSYAQERAIRSLSRDYQDLPERGLSAATLNVLLSLDLAEPDHEGSGYIGPFKAYKWRLTREGAMHKMMLERKVS